MTKYANRRFWRKRSCNEVKPRLRTQDKWVPLSLVSCLTTRQGSRHETLRTRIPGNSLSALSFICRSCRCLRLCRPNVQCIRNVCYAVPHNRYTLLLEQKKKKSVFYLVLQQVFKAVIFMLIYATERCRFLCFFLSLFLSSPPPPLILCFIA